MSTPAPQPATAPRPRRHILWNAAGLAIALIAIVAALALWTGTDQFQRLVRTRLAAQLQNMTGGRVEIGDFRWHVFQLSAEAANVVIHGDEPAGEAPYARIDRLQASFSVLGVLSPRVLLRDLEITRPRLHILVYPDGKTNQPHPTHPSRSRHSGIDTLFSLQAGHVAVTNGIIHLDNRAASLDFENRYQPLDFRGDDVSLTMVYAAEVGARPESYHLDIGVRDLNLTRGGSLAKTMSPVEGRLAASLDLTRDAAYLRSLRLTAHTRGAPDRTLNIIGDVQHFAEPRWQAQISGDLDLRLLDPVLGYEFAPEGIAHLNLATAGASGQFRIDGSIHAEHASYIGTGVVARGIDLTTRVHADQNQLRITDVTARLQQGGDMTGEVILSPWIPPSSGGAVMEPSPAAAPAPPHPSLRKRLGSHLHLQAPPAAPPQPASHWTLVKAPDVDIHVNGKVTANFHNVSLDTILDLVSQPPFQRLGIATLVNGPAVATWSGGDENTLTVKSLLNLSPAAPAPAGEVPGSGTIDATYVQRDGSVDVRTLDLNLPSSRVQAHGRLGAYPLTNPITALNVDFQSRNLAEFDTVFRDLGLQREGKSGAAALPIAVQGQGSFDGIWAGSLESPRLSGNLHATQVALELPVAPKPQWMRWDSIDAQGSYAAEQIAIVHGDLKRGPSQVLIDGTLTSASPVPPAANGKRVIRGAEVPDFTEASIAHIRARAVHLDVAELLPLTGSQLPVSGFLDAQLAVDGPLQQLAGAGSVQLADAVIQGEPLTSVRAQGTYKNHVLNLASFAASAPAGTVSGSGSYDVSANRIQAQAQTTGLDLAKVKRLHDAAPELAGRLALSVAASGTRAEPRIEARGNIAGLSLSGESLGNLSLIAHTQNRALLYDLATHLDAAEVSLHGQTEMHDDYQTQAALHFAQLNIGSLFNLAHLGRIGAQSALAGSASIAGPLARPAELRGDLRIPQLAVVISGVHLQSPAAIHAALANNQISLDPVHITGDDTDLNAQGNFSLAENHAVNFAAAGSVNLKLAQTIDPDVTAGGTSTFQVEAHGPLDNPNLRGTIDFQNGSIALEDLPNGLSQVHGRLRFNQNRLQVESLTAMTGGGQLSLGGFLAYQHGLFADLSVSGKSIRIRYPQGVSSLADTTLHLQGTPASLLLSGNIYITRFAVSPDLDIAALATQALAVQPVAPPDAPSNRVRLDVRVQSSPQLNFQNAYAKLAGDVDLRLRGTLANPSLLGRISITEGNAVIAGTRYELQRGDVTFSNPVRIQPNIDLNATARVEDYDITLGLHGTPDKMSVTYRSDPPLPEADVVALLALGRTQSEQGLYTQQQQQSVGLSTSTDVLLGGALNATVSSRVQKLFGAGSVKVDPSYLGALGNSTTRITVEEQVGKSLTLTYATNVDTSAQQLLQAEIAINRHVALLVTRDESGVFSMVVKATRRYR